jgi:capsular exopolysaccharide synthesis family protein
MPATEVAPTNGYPWPTTVPAAALVPNVSAGNILHSLRRRWWVGAALGILFAITFAIAAWYLVPSREEVSAVLHIRRNDDRLLDNSTRIVQKEEFEAFKMTQAGLVKHKLTLQAALAQNDPETGLELARNREVQKHGDPIRWLEEKLNVEFPGDAELMFVTLAGDEPKELVKIVNAICTAYLNDVTTAEQQAAKIQLSRISQKYDDTAQELAEAQRKLSQLASKAGVPGKQSAQASHAAKLTLFTQRNQHAMEMERTLIATNEKLVEAQAELAVAQGLVVTDGQLEHELLKDELYQEKVKARDNVKKALSEAESKMVDPKSRKLATLHTMLDGLEREIDEYKEQMRPIIEEHLKGPQREAELQSKINALTTLKEGLETNLKTAREEIASLQGELTRITETSPELEKWENDIQLLGKSLDQLRDAKLKLQVLVDKPPQITKVADATVPESSSQMFKIMAVVFAAFFGFSLPMVGITFWDFQQHRVNRPHDASSALGLKILGALPAVAGRKGRKAAQGKASALALALQHSLADSVDGVRTALLRDNAAEGTRVVLVTSAIHHEGKTTLATQLATSLARAGKRTLLIDGDLRKPTAHRLFGLSLDPGLCEVLRGECELEETLRPTRAGGLWMMTAGRCDEEALHDLAKDGVGEIFKQLRTGFDFIIMDTSPVLATADALVIGQYVDAAILSVLRDASRVPTVFEACDRLRGVGIRVLGTVFNGVRQEVRHNGAAKRLPAKAASL